MIDKIYPIRVSVSAASSQSNTFFMKGFVPYIEGAAPLVTDSFCLFMLLLDVLKSHLNLI